METKSDVTRLLDVPTGISNVNPVLPFWQCPSSNVHVPVAASQLNLPGS